MTLLQKLPKNVGKLIVAKGFEKLPKVHKLPCLVTLLVTFLGLSFDSMHCLFIIHFLL